MRSGVLQLPTTFCHYATFIRASSAQSIWAIYVWLCRITFNAQWCRTVAYNILPLCHFYPRQQHSMSLRRLCLGLSDNFLYVVVSVHLPRTFCHYTTFIRISSANCLWDICVWHCQITFYMEWCCTVAYNILPLRYFYRRQQRSMS